MTRAPMRTQQDWYFLLVVDTITSNVPWRLKPNTTGRRAGATGSSWWWWWWWWFSVDQLLRGREFWKPTQRFIDRVILLVGTKSYNDGGHLMNGWAMGADGLQLPRGRKSVGPTSFYSVPVECFWDIVGYIYQRKQMNSLSQLTIPKIEMYSPYLYNQSLACTLPCCPINIYWDGLNRLSTIIRKCTVVWQS